MRPHQKTDGRKCARLFLFIPFPAMPCATRVVNPLLQVYVLHDGKVPSGRTAHGVVDTLGFGWPALQKLQRPVERASILSGNRLP
jgi:hypothetical protein